MSCLLLWLWKKMQFQLPLNKTFCTTPPPLIHHQFKHHQKKINRTMLSASPSSVFDTKFTISVLKSKQVFHLNSNWTRTASVWVLNWVSILLFSGSLYAHWFWTQFHKREIKNWLPTGFNLTLITTTLS